MVTFDVKSNNGRDIWLEALVQVSGEDAIQRKADAERAVRCTLEAAAEAFPRYWPRHLCDWCRIESVKPRGGVVEIVVRMPVPMGRYVLALPHAEAVQEAAS